MLEVPSSAVDGYSAGTRGGNQPGKVGENVEDNPHLRDLLQHLPPIVNGVLAWCSPLSDVVNQSEAADALLAQACRGEAFIHVDLISFLGKRKRAQVSYAEDNAELDRLIFGERFSSDEEVEDEDSDDGCGLPIVDDDAEFGKKASKRAIATRKQAKRVKRGRASRVKLVEKPFPFLRLPLELRYMIYGYALTDHEVALCAKTKSLRRTVTRWDNRLAQRAYDTNGEMIAEDVAHTPNNFVPALLATNKQIHDEAVVFLYGQRLAFEDLYALHSFLAEIGLRNCKVLADVTVKAWGHGRGVHRAMNFCAFAMLASCTNLRSLTLDCEVGWSWRTDAKRLAKTIYRNAHHFLEALAAAKGSCNAAIDVIRLNESNFGSAAFFYYGDTKSVEEKQFKQKYRAELKRLLAA
nr:hypothetical protein CFP56_13376 [Quercus suber]